MENSFTVVIGGPREESERAFEMRVMRDIFTRISINNRGELKHSFINVVKSYGNDETDILKIWDKLSEEDKNKIIIDCTYEKLEFDSKWLITEPSKLFKDVDYIIDDTVDRNYEKSLRKQIKKSRNHLEKARLQNELNSLLYRNGKHRRGKHGKH